MFVLTFTVSDNPKPKKVHNHCPKQSHECNRKQTYQNSRWLKSKWLKDKLKRPDDSKKTTNNYAHQCDTMVFRSLQVYSTINTHLLDPKDSQAVTIALYWHENLSNDLSLEEMNLKSFESPVNVFRNDKILVRCNISFHNKENQTFINRDILWRNCTFQVSIYSLIIIRCIKMFSSFFVLTGYG